MWDGSRFRGAKLALLQDGAILAYLRDDKANIPFPGRWDLPGGGREGDESPIECALRELEEEFALRLPADRIEWERFYPTPDLPPGGAFFLAGTIRADEIASIRFGDEGQCWRMMSLHEFLTHSLTVPYLVSRLGDMLGD
jgi:8-oxo-dGTP diphosphatase